MGAGNAPAGFEDIGVCLHLLLTGWIGLGLLVLAAVVLGLCVWLNVDGYSGFWLLSGTLALFGAIAGIAWLVMLVPFNGTYQHDYQVKGHVEAVSNTFSDANGDLTRTPILTLDTVDRPLVVDDPRAISTKGRDVVLKCRIEWNFRAADSYSCSVIDFGGAR